MSLGGIPHHKTIGDGGIPMNQRREVGTERLKMAMFQKTSTGSLKT